MPSLSSKERASLPDTSFAYVDSKGQRRLPIHDAAHVRNALARFSQVRFESEQGRAGARERLLKAARRHGIVPIGFITGQLDAQSRRAAAAHLLIELARIRTSAELETALRQAIGDESLTLLHHSRTGYRTTAGEVVGPGDDRRSMTRIAGRPIVLVHAPGALSDPDVAEAVQSAVGFVVERERLDGETVRRPDPSSLPTGFVTHLLTDIEGSTPLLAQLGSRYAQVLTDVRQVIRQEVVAAGGIEVEARADEFQAVFTDAASALTAAVALQRVLAGRSWPDQVPVRVRAGVHSGEIEVVDGGYVGLSIHVAARVCGAARGGQVLASAAVIRTAGAPPGLRYAPAGQHRLAGLTEPEDLFMVEGDSP